MIGWILVGFAGGVWFSVLFLFLAERGESRRNRKDYERWEAATNRWSQDRWK